MAVVIEVVKGERGLGAVKVGAWEKEPVGCGD